MLESHWDAKHRHSGPNCDILGCRRLPLNRHPRPGPNVAASSRRETKCARRPSTARPQSRAPVIAPGPNPDRCLLAKATQQRRARATCLLRDSCSRTTTATATAAPQVHPRLQESQWARRDRYSRRRKVRSLCNLRLSRRRQFPHRLLLLLLLMGPQHQALRRRQRRRTETKRRRRTKIQEMLSRSRYACLQDGTCVTRAPLEGYDADRFPSLLAAGSHLAKVDNNETGQGSVAAQHSDTSQCGSSYDQECECLHQPPG